jgi:hypothetical protein
MSELLVNETSPTLTSSVEDSPVRTCRPLARTLACKVLEAAFGTSSNALLRSAARAGLWSKTWQAAQLGGLIPWSGGWNGSGMLAYRSRLRQAMLALRTSESECSSLPTIRATDAGRGGRGDLIAVLRGNPNPHSGGMLPTLTATANLLSPSMAKWPKHRALRAVLLPATIKQMHQVGTGHHLNPDWCRWYMGFPPGWLDALDASK